MKEASIVTTPTTVRWRVISHISRSRYFLNIIELPFSNSASEIVKELGARHDQSFTRLKSFVNHVLLFRKPIFGTASLAPIMLDSSTFKCYPCQVIVSKSEKDEVLTQAFKNPGLLGRSDSFLHQYQMFKVDHDSDGAGSCCLMMSYGLDKGRLAAAFFVVMMFCVAVGVVAGLVSDRIDMGFLFGGGAISFLTSAQVTLFWVFG